MVSWQSLQIDSDNPPAKRPTFSLHYPAVTRGRPPPKGSTFSKLVDKVKRSPTHSAMEEMPSHNRRNNIEKSLFWHHQSHRINHMFFFFWDTNDSLKTASETCFRNTNPLTKAIKAKQKSHYKNKPYKYEITWKKVLWILSKAQGSLASPPCTLCRHRHHRILIEALDLHKRSTSKT